MHYTNKSSVTKQESLNDLEKKTTILISLELFFIEHFLQNSYWSTKQLINVAKISTSKITMLACHPYFPI